MIKLYLTESEYNYVNELMRNQIEQLKNMSPTERKIGITPLFLTSPLISLKK